MTGLAVGPSGTPAADTGIVDRTIPLGRPVPPVLGVGAFLKNTVCLTQGTEALLSPDLGNLESVAAVRAFETAVARLLDRAARAGAAPVAIAHDLHPDFHSTRFAETLAARRGLPAVPVQHHHAHVAAVLAEHGSAGPVLGLALDGFGLGPGNQAWGGELLRVDAAGYARLGHLIELRQPGGDVAARQPWRMAAAALHALGRGAEIAGRFAAFGGAPVIAAMLDRGLNCPATSSAGRLFDAACGLLGVVPVARFEGEAPMALEALVSRPQADPQGWRLGADGVLDLLPLLDRLAGLDPARGPAEGADLFHGTLIAALTAWAVQAAEQTGLRDVVLCGGCLLNKVLRAGLTETLARHGLTPLLPRRLGPGDIAISLGQAWAAALLIDPGRARQGGV